MEVSVPAAILLGVVQGLTEFLPISSSGHLAVAQHFLPGFRQPGVLFDIILHLGTLLAVLTYFRSELGLVLRGLVPQSSGASGRRLAGLLLVGTLPAAITGLALGNAIKGAFTELSVVGLGLVVTGGLLLASSRLRRAETDLDEMSVLDAVTVGLLQSAALLPGISRSGSTIVAGLARGLTRESAARFSFLLSVPAIVGAAAYELPQVAGVPAAAAGGYLVGFITAFAVGYGSITVVLRALAHERFHWFGYYCLIVGGGVLVYVATALS